MGLPLLISDYRQKKILKRYKVTPTSLAFLLAVWVAIYAIYSLLSLLLVFETLFLFFGCRFSGSFGIFLITYILVMLSMFSIGLMVGGLAPDTKMASVVASILYFPMLIFSGATLPYEVMPSALQKVAIYVASDTWDKATKSIIIRIVDRVGVDADCDYAGVHDCLWRNCNPVL